MIRNLETNSLKFIFLIVQFLEHTALKSKYFIIVFLLRFVFISIPRDSIKKKKDLKLTPPQMNNIQVFKKMKKKKEKENLLIRSML
jgi:hypothetical protein